MTDRSRANLLFIAIVAAAFALKAPLATNRVRVTPDAVSYRNVARNLASGQGFVSTLKLHHLDKTGVRHTALSEWPPLYPLFAAIVIRCGGDLAALQLANTLLVSIAAGIVFLIGARLFDWRAGLLAGTAAMLAPNVFRAGCVAMSDALGLALALAALLLALMQKRRLIVPFAAGMLAGAAAMTRFPNAVVGVALVGSMYMRRESRRHAFACAAGLACVVAPFAAWLWLCRESPFGQVQALHYGVGSFHHAMWNANAVTDPWYAARHAGPVASAVLHNALFYASDLLAGPRGLFALGAGLILGILGRRAGAMTREKKLVLAVAALSFGVYAFTWSIPPVKGSRFMLLSYCLILPFCAAGLVNAPASFTSFRAARTSFRAARGICFLRGRQSRFLTAFGMTHRLIATVACLITAGVYVWGCLTAASYTAGECAPLAPGISERVACSLPSGTSIASNNPWVVSYSTGAPTALLPCNLDREALARYVSRLGIGEIVLLGERPRSRTADTVRACYAIEPVSRGVALALTKTHNQGQKAYEGRLKMTPQMVQKLPTTHSPRITPRKNGSARL